MATMDEPIDLSAQMQLAGEEESPSLGAFIKNEREPRKDQPLFSLNEGRESLTKNLSSDFMPLNKKLADKEAPSSIVPTFATADNGALIKGHLPRQRAVMPFKWHLHHPLKRSA